MRKPKREIDEKGRSVLIDSESGKKFVATGENFSTTFHAGLDKTSSLDKGQVTESEQRENQEQENTAQAFERMSRNSATRNQILANVPQKVQLTHTPLYAEDTKKEAEKKQQPKPIRRITVRGKTSGEILGIDSRKVASRDEKVDLEEKMPEVENTQNVAVQESQVKSENDSQTQSQTRVSEELQFNIQENSSDNSVLPNFGHGWNEFMKEMVIAKAEGKTIYINGHVFKFDREEKKDEFVTSQKQNKVSVRNDEDRDDR